MVKLAVIGVLLLAGILLVSSQSADCPCNCKRNRQPVCGRNAEGANIQYNNDCLMECANRCDNAGVTLTDKAACGIEE